MGIVDIEKNSMYFKKTCAVPLLFILILSSSFMAYADVCIEKPDFPGSEFRAIATYEMLSGDRIKFDIVVDGVSSSTAKKLQFYYGVPDDFVWSIDEQYKGGYEFLSDIFFEEGEAKLYLNKDFPGFSLHLSLLPKPARNQRYCVKDYYIVVSKKNITENLKRGYVGDFISLK